MEIHSMRIDHGPVQTNTMSYPQRQPQNHRPNHSQASHATVDIYKPSRSPLSTARYPYPSSPQLQQQQQQQPATIGQVQRYPTQTPPAAGAVAASAAPPLLSGVYRDLPAYRQNRISLLHPEYGPGRPRETTIQAGVVCVDGLQGGQQPLKKIRLQDKEGMQPLRIDTREQPGTYNPQVEAISPTLPDQLTQDDQAFRTTKDELIQQIGKVDREIAKAESQIAILKKKQAELEEIANKPAVKPEVEEDTAPTHQSLPQKIYAENRKRAQNAHAQLDSLGPKVEWPLYNQPSDAPVYHENKRKHVAFKRRLLEYFKRRHGEKEARNTYLTDTYSKMMQEWLRKVDKIESSTKRKAKEAKNREFFEKVFPELRKQREDKERFNRVGARVKSEADMEEIMDNLQEQAMEDKKMRSYAVIPPILLDQRARRIRYEDNNGYVEDMEAVYKSRQFLNVWTPSEKELFKEKYLQHPKNFGVIASYLDRKSVSDCVQYYYLSKKTENYKQLFRKARQRTRSSRNNTQKVNAANPNTSVVDIMTSGVTTRLQREQQAKTGQQGRDPHSAEPATSTTPPAAPTAASPLSSSPTTIGATATTTATTTTTSAAAPSPSTNCASAPGTPTSTGGAAAPTPFSNSNCVSTSTSVILTSCSVTAASSAPAHATTAASDKDAPMDTTEEPKAFASDDFAGKGKFFDEEGGGKEAGAGAGLEAQKQNVAQDGVRVKKEVESPQEVVSDQNTTCGGGNAVTENKKKKERRKDKDTTIETSDEEVNAVQDKATQGNCVVCQSQLGPQLHSRPLAASQASQYGLREDQVPANSRVCNTCRCKCVRSRYTHCPLPACPNSRGRVKRLRSFPYRLQDLPNDVREPLLAEFRIPSGVTKCCSACFNRIQRRLGPAEEWPEEEVGKLRAALADVGGNWQLIGERLNKPSHQVRNFYAANRKRLNLEGCLGDRKPTLTDEEESGSSTSSCEEPMRERGHSHSSDTASAAESPPVQGANSIPIKKEDYDSSATETADEAQTPDHYQVSATITPVTSGGGAGEQRQNTSPLSVKDIVVGVIENSFKKAPPQQQQPPTQVAPVGGMAPTISSILNNDSNEVTIVSEYNLNNIGAQHRAQLLQVQQQRTDLNLAKITPLIGATITPVSGPIQSQQQLEPVPSSRDDLIVLQVQDGRGEPETLDLSLKKPREPQPPPIHSKHQQQQQQIHRADAYIYHQQERKSPAFASMRPQPKLPSPKPANPKAGSITMGTPIISQQSRGAYEGLLRQMPEAKMGSITQGTPIHMPNVQDKRMYEYFNKQRAQQQQQPQQQYQQQQQQQQQHGQYRQYDQQLSSQQLTSRQIIMNDYITSQQMLSRRTEKAQYYPAHRTPPPPQQQQQQQQQQRQGVIQRHTRPQYLQPGHEALSSLVDVAVQQPSLPVPSAPHEGLGKTMADNILEQPHRYQIIQQQHQQQQLRQQQQQQHRMEEQRRAAAAAAAYHQQQQQQQHHHQAAAAAAAAAAARQQQQQQRTDSSTLTAASLIDAIITHQINQTAEGGRGGEVVTNAREQRAGDLLFQNFHRGEPPSQQQQQQQQQQQDNGDRPPSVISVDLDGGGGDGMGKSLTVKELTDSVISHDFGARQPNSNYYHMQQQQQQHESVNEQWKRRMQQHKEEKRAQTPQQQQQQQQQDERQIIRIAQPQQQQQQQQQQQKYHMESRVEPVSPPETNHWSSSAAAEQNYRRYQQPQSHISPLDYVKNRIVEVMRTEDDKKEDHGHGHGQPDKERSSDSPGDMVIDEEKHDGGGGAGFYSSFMHNKEGAGSVVVVGAGGEGGRSNEPKPLLSAQYEPLSDED